MSVHEELEALADELTARARYSEDETFAKPLAALESAASSVGRASSGSWFGYHSRVYYADFQPPPPGAHFSSEWGLMETFSSIGSSGEWREYSAEDVLAEIDRRAEGADITAAEERGVEVAEFFEDAQSTVVSRLVDACRRDTDDTYLSDLLEKAKGLTTLGPAEFIAHASPKGQQMSRDSNAITAGVKIPPHVVVISRILASQQPAEACRDLAKIAQRTASHLTNRMSVDAAKARIGTSVFIGHGRSAAWKDLREFLRDRVHLPWDEFNRVPVAGVTNIARLSEMLNSAAIAFLVMTAEDEQLDGSMHARMNVVHEAGLFQGRLGFERAIVLLEEGCAEFSNIQGLGQIRFPPGRLSAVFEDIRAVLEREGLLE